MEELADFQIDALDARLSLDTALSSGAKAPTSLPSASLARVGPRKSPHPHKASNSLWPGGWWGASHGHSLVLQSLEPREVM